MGEMADYALESVEIMEDLRDQYVSGDMRMEDAYENGFLDEMGVEQEGIQDAWDRAVIPTKENLNNQLNHAIKDLEIATLRSQTQSKTLSNPTCNVCSNEMPSRVGKFGKFYYCNCPEQVTVSDAYWKRVQNSVDV